MRRKICEVAMEDADNEDQVLIAIKAGDPGGTEKEPRRQHGRNEQTDPQSGGDFFAGQFLFLKNIGTDTEFPQGLGDIDQARRDRIKPGFRRRQQPRQNDRGQDIDRQRAIAFGEGKEQRTADIGHLFLPLALAGQARGVPATAHPAVRLPTPKRDPLFLFHLSPSQQRQFLFKESPQTAGRTPPLQRERFSNYVRPPSPGGLSSHKLGALNAQCRSAPSVRPHSPGGLSSHKLGAPLALVVPLPCTMARRKVYHTRGRPCFI